jgi:hypothetical protein
MKRNAIALFCGLLGILGMAVAVSSRVNGEGEIPIEKLVSAIRFLNTQEYNYRYEIGPFATRDELLAFLRKNGELKGSPIDLESPNPYELAIATSPDGTHYQITLKRPANVHDESTWCKTAAFSDDAGVIFVGAAIDCKTPTP